MVRATGADVLADRLEVAAADGVALLALTIDERIIILNQFRRPTRRTHRTTRRSHQRTPMAAAGGAGLVDDKCGASCLGWGSTALTPPCPHSHHPGVEAMTRMCHERASVAARRRARLTRGQIGPTPLAPRPTHGPASAGRLHVRPALWGCRFCGLLHPIAACPRRQDVRRRKVHPRLRLAAAVADYGLRGGQRPHPAVSAQAERNPALQLRVPLRADSGDRIQPFRSVSASI